MVAETEQKTVLRNGLRILAHMIARAYLRDVRAKQSLPTSSYEKVKEDSNNERGQVQSTGVRLENTCQDDCPGLPGRDRPR
jgi:hypothetical protein